MNPATCAATRLLQGSENSLCPEETPLIESLNNFIKVRHVMSRDASAEYGPHKTLPSRWKRWSEKGTFAQMLLELVDVPNHVHHRRQADNLRARSKAAIKPLNLTVPGGQQRSHAQPTRADYCHLVAGEDLVKEHA